MINLPEHKAPDDLWDKIEAHLEGDYQENNKETLRKAINQLPVYKANEAIWNKILEKLDEKSVFIFSNNSNLIINISKIAAVFVLLFSLTIVVYNQIKLSPKETIIYTEEVFETGSQFEDESISMNHMENFIAMNCEKIPETCTKPEFKELKNQLEELKQEAGKIKEMLKQHKDPNLEKFLYRIENDQMQIQKEITQLFI